jgi:GNAT superfamily N-acetyltransferase
MANDSLCVLRSPLKPITITYLEMRSPSALRPKPNRDQRFWIRETIVKQWQFNRFLYLLVGADWSWTDKRSWSEQQWQDYAESERLRTFGAFYDGSVAGYYELRADDDAGIEIAIFGLAPPFVGRGLGGVMLTHAIEEAWRQNPARVWLHTCTLDHPAALANYLARGLTIYKAESHPAAAAGRDQGSRIPL